VQILALGEAGRGRVGLIDGIYGGLVESERDIFADPGEEASALADMTARWPNAEFREDSMKTAPYAGRIFDPSKWQCDRPLNVVMIGTDFEVRVWRTLLKIPMGKATTYSDIARTIGNPNASRAVGAAVGKNPLSFVVPCHRVIGRSGALTGYHWGLTRKQAMLGWEGGRGAAGRRDFLGAQAFSLHLPLP